MKCKYCKMCDHTGMFGDDPKYRCHHPEAPKGEDANLPTKIVHSGKSRFLELPQKGSPPWCPVKKENDLNTPWPYTVCDIDGQPLNGPDINLRADRITDERVITALVAHDYIRRDVTAALNMYEVRMLESGNIHVIRRSGITPMFILKRKGA